MQNMKPILYKALKKLLTATLLFLIPLFCNSIIEASVAKPEPDVKIKASQISREDIIKLIKEQGEKDSYYLDNLSYQLVNVDNDNALEIIAQTYGGVHLGHFFLFVRNSNGKYILAAEKPWKVEEISIAEYPNLIGGIKLNQLTERTGGSGLDIYSAHLWYLKDKKFIEAWEGKLKERSFFQGIWYLEVSGYQYIDDFYKLYTWSSNYSIDTNSYKPITKPTTTVSIFEFDGDKFILDSKEKFKHSKVYPDIQSPDR